MLQGLKEIGSLIFWMSLLDTAMVCSVGLFFIKCCQHNGVVWLANLCFSYDKFVVILLSFLVL